jgi:holo-[acyl-carrier protein] synthase
MIIGIGIDIIEIDRIKNSVDRYGDQFLNKIFTKNEIAYCLNKADKYQHLAARFAAKEAIYKALASGWDKSIGWQNIEIKNELNGLPYAVLNGEIKSFLSGDKGLRISLTHSRDYVASVAIIYKEG